MDTNVKDIDEKLSAKYKIKRPSCNKDEADKLKVLAADRLSENPEWKKDWLTEDSVTRFLKAFLTVEDTLNALDEYCNWRRDEDVDAIAALDATTNESLLKEEAKGRDRILFDYYDRCGRPLLLVTVRNHDGSHGDYASLFRYILYVLEKMSSLADENSFDRRYTIIFDLKGFSFSNIDYKFVKESLNVLRFYYPERIGTCLIINFPRIFYGCWNVIKLWMNDVTRSKFIFAGKEKLTDFVELEKLPVVLFPSS